MTSIFECPEMIIVADTVSNFKPSLCILTSEVYINGNICQ
jgi:hypothetical protein